jgi:hypothetical protein
MKALPCILLLSLIGASTTGFAQTEGAGEKEIGAVSTAAPTGSKIIRPAVEAIINSHESTWAQLQTVRVTVTHTSDREGTGIYKPHSIDSWIRRGPKECFKRSIPVTNGQMDGSQPDSYEMWLDFESHQFHFLNIPDPTKLHLIRPDRHYGISALRAPLDRYFLDAQIYLYFLIRFQMNGLDDFRTLRELRDECSSFELLANQEINGFSCAHFHVVHPGVRGMGVGTEMDIFLDPQMGYLARRLEVHHRPAKSDKTTTAANSDFVVEVGEFRSLPGGVFFPAKAECYSRDDQGRRESIHNYVANEIVVNEEISPREVAVVFPQHAFVNVFTEPRTPFSLPAKTNVELIGAKGEVIQTFHPDTEELPTFLYNFRKENGLLEESEIDQANSQPSGGNSGWQTWLFTGGILAIFVLCGVVWISWRRNRSGNLPS